MGRPFGATNPDKVGCSLKTKKLDLHESSPKGKFVLETRLHMAFTAGVGGRPQMMTCLLKHADIHQIKWRQVVPCQQPGLLAMLKFRGVERASDPFLARSLRPYSSQY